SFEEGYVAFTRGRASTHLYLVDGSAELDEPDLAHQSHSTTSTGLDTMTEALARTNANELAHDQSAVPARLIGNLTLGELREQRRRIEAVLRLGPPNVDTHIGDIEEERDRLLARRSALSLKSSSQLPRINRRLADVERQLDHLASLHA